MKRTLSVFLALAMTVSMTTVAFAWDGEPQKSGRFSGIAEFEGVEFDPGDTVTLDVDYFYGKWTETEKEWDNKKEKEVTVRKTYDNENEPIGSLDKEYHKVSASWTSGGQYIQSVYFEDGDPYVSIELKGEASTVDREITGTIKIIEDGIPNRDKVTYKCEIKKGKLIIKGVDERSRMVYMDDKKFGLPTDYQKKQVRFATDDGESYGTFVGEFYSEKNGRDLAEFRVRIIDQSSLYLGFSESANKTIANKYPEAELTFINWTARPTFAYSGKLSIYMDSDEYIYGIKDDNSLYHLGGSYDKDNYAYVIDTKTLGSYVISNVQLTASGSGSTGSSGGGTTTVTSPSSSAAPSSAAPSSTAPAPSSTAPQPSSSVAPQPSSSVAPSSSSEDPSSDPEEESSVPEDEEPSEPDEEEPYEPDDDDDGDGEDEEKPEKKGFPLVPVLFGVLGIVILVCAVVVVGNRNNGRRARNRRRRYDDDWDD